MRHVWGTPLVYFCKFWDSIKCHRMRRLTADGANVLPLHAMLSHVQEGKGWLEKCLAESPLVRHVWGTPLVYFCKFWDSIKCHRMRRLTADGANVLPLHALLTHLQEG